MSIYKQTQKKTSSTPNRSFKPRPGLLQRKCACGGTPGVDGECTECRNKRLFIQRSAINQAESSTVSPIVHTVLNTSGQPLDSATRTQMEPRFGYDFSKVRVHTDAKAAESAHAVNALAYTVGRDVVFAAGHYKPETQAGKKLIAHELAHVIQQDSGKRGMQRAPSVSGAKDSSEKQAEDTAQAVVSSSGSTTKAGSCPDIAVPHLFLQKGSIHPAVREAQRKLNLYHSLETAAGRAGLKDAPLVEDCNFGGKTFNAVYSFQQQSFPKQPREYDGKIGDHTWAELDKVGTMPPAPAQEESRKVPTRFNVKTENRGRLEEDGKVKDLKIKTQPKEASTVTPSKSDKSGETDDPLFQFTSGLGIQMPTLVHLAGSQQPDDICNHIVSQIGGKWNWKGLHPTNRLTLGGALELDLSFSPAFCKKSPFFTPQLQEDLVKFVIMKDVWELTLQGAFGLQDDWLKNFGVNLQGGFELDWKPWGSHKDKFYSAFKIDADGFITWSIGPDKTVDVGGAVKVGFEIP